MGIFSRIGNLIFRNEVQTGLTLEQLRDMIAGGRASSEAGIDVSADSAMRSSTVFSCVRVLAETAAQLPFPVYKRSANGRDVDREHPLTGLLNRRPNRWQTAFEFREMMTAFVVLRGNAYAYVGRDPLTDRPNQLVPLRPGTVRPVQREDLSIEYLYTPAGGSPRPLQQRDVLHLRGISDGGIEGISPVTAFRNAVGLSLAAERHQSKSFANGVKIPGVLTTKAGLKPEAIKTLRESFADMHKAENAFKMPVLEEGMTYTATGMNADDAQTIETRQFQRGEIASIFRVPLHMINGDTEASKGWSTLEQQASEFVTYSMVPWFERWEQAVARDLLSPAEQETHYVEHKVASLLRGDTTQRFAAYNVAINSGWLSRNEVRELENLNPVDGLSEYLQPLNMTKAVEEEQKRRKEQHAARR